jgi:hypothetical protein
MEILFDLTGPTWMTDLRKSLPLLLLLLLPRHRILLQLSYIRPQVSSLYTDSPPKPSREFVVPPFFVCVCVCVCLKSTHFTFRQCRFQCRLSKFIFLSHRKQLIMLNSSSDFAAPRRQTFWVYFMNLSFLRAILRHYATSRKVAAFIPDEAIVFFSQLT